MNVAKIMTIRDLINTSLLKLKKKGESSNEFLRRIIIICSIDTLIKLRGSTKFVKKSDLLDEMNKKRGEQSRKAT